MNSRNFCVCSIRWLTQKLVEQYAEAKEVISESAPFSEFWLRRAKEGKIIIIIIVLGKSQKDKNVTSKNKS